MSHDNYLSEDAERDITNIYEYIFYNDSQEKADYVYSRIKECISKLQFNPERGHYPREFETLGIAEYLEIHFKPYRIIYHIQDKNVTIHCVLDGRRDLEEILHYRLLR